MIVEIQNPPSWIDKHIKKEDENQSNKEDNKKIIKITENILISLH